MFKRCPLCKKKLTELNWFDGRLFLYNYFCKCSYEMNFRENKKLNDKFKIKIKDDEFFIENDYVKNECEVNSYLHQFLQTELTQEDIAKNTLYAPIVVGDNISYSHYHKSWNKISTSINYKTMGKSSFPLKRGRVVNIADNNYHIEYELINNVKKNFADMVIKPGKNVANKMLLYLSLS